jgi:cytidylate kinase
MRAHPQIAIDGAAGTGKSTIGECVARRIDALYVDTGAFYRTLAYLALRTSTEPDDADALARLAGAMRLEIVPPRVADGRQYTVLVDGRDVTPELRTSAVEAAVSRVSRHLSVRAVLRTRQRELANGSSVVMVGRDIGTVVLPDADLKIHLKTSLAARAERRHADLVAKLGTAAPTLSAVREEIAQRDALDAPNMRVAADAVEIDNTELEAAEVVRRICALLTERLQAEA